ncbi:MAG: right-handed parallel beta-helix repeat-containing protein [bacterium]
MRHTAIPSVLVALLIFVGGCKKDDGGDDWSGQCVEHAASCAGVPARALGSGTWYTENATCAQIWYVRDGATGGTGDQSAPFGDLPDAATVAADGDCIALSAGAYSGATLSGGVSLLGAGAGVSTISTTGTAVLALVNGAGALVRGVQLTGGLVGLYTSDASQLTVESVLVNAVQRIGVQIVGGADITLRQLRIADLLLAPGDDAAVGLTSIDAQGLFVESVLVENNPGSGIIVRDGDIWVRDSVIRNNDGYGIAGSCPGCTSTRPQVILHNNLVQGNELVGIWLMSVDAEVRDNLVADTRNAQVPGSPPTSRQIETNNVPVLELFDNQLDLGEDIGVLLHESSGELGGNVISNHGGRGIWAQNIAGTNPSSFLLTDNEVVGNREVSVGLKGDCDVTISGGVVSDTQDKPIVVEGHSSVVGDGVQALTDTILDVQTVTFDANGRTGILVDGAVDATVTNSQFGESDVDAIVVQNVSWDPFDSISGNTGTGGVQIGYTEFTSPTDFLAWDPFDMPAGWDPFDSVPQ